MKVIINTRIRTEWPQENEAIPPSPQSPMAGCFDVKSRAVSLDSKSAPTASRLDNFLSMFRSKSAPSIKQSSSRSGGVARSSSSASGSTPKRRYVRVVRDENAPPPEKCDENPYIRREYTQEFLAKHYANRSQDQLVSRPSYASNTAHTILKKSSTDPTPSSEKSTSSLGGKHATFKDIVEVVEFGELDQAESGLQCKQQWKLHDEPMEGGVQHNILAEANKRDGFFLDAAAVDDELEADEDVDSKSAMMESSPPVESVAPIVRRTSASRDLGAMMSVFSPITEPVSRTVVESKTKRVEISQLPVHKDNPSEIHTNQ